jgi:hypothetical protein
VRFGVGISPGRRLPRKPNPEAGRPNTPVGSLPIGNNGNAEAFALHAKRSASFDLRSSDSTQRGNRSGAAYVRDATGSNGPARPARNATGCAPTQSMPQQGTIAPQGTTATDPRAEPLSDKLARSEACSARPQELTRKFAHQSLRRAICRSFLRPAALAAIRRSGRNKSGVAGDLKQQHPKIWK